MQHLTKRLREPQKEILQKFSKTEAKQVELSCYDRLGEFKNNDQLIKLSLELTWMQRFLGSKEPLSDHDEDELISFLLEFFSDFTLPELKFAAQMSAADELPIKDNEHYNRFGSIYISKILKAYRILRNRALFKYTKAETAIAEEKNARANPLSEKQKLRILRTGTLRRFEQFKAKGNVYDVGHIAFEFLYQSGAIEKIMGERKMALETKAREKMKLEATYSSDPTEKKKLQNYIELLEMGDKTGKRKMWSIMKHLAVHEYFTQLVADGKELIGAIYTNSRCGKVRKNLTWALTL